MIYFFSDPHYSHTNICRGVSRWPPDKQKETRPFDTLEQMNDAIVNAINSRVKLEDELYCLGDWSFGDPMNIWHFRKRINCGTIYLIYGNHDENIEKNIELVIPQEDVPRYEQLFLERMGSTVAQRTIRVQELFSTVGHYKKLFPVRNQMVILSHYSMRVWEKSHRGSIQLHGHSHGTLKGYEEYKTMDVGIDTRKDYKPYSWNEIMDIMSSRKILGVDHHGEKTN